MLNKFKQAAVFSLGTLISTTALAEINANLGATTEYVREGISQTRGKPTLQAGLTWQHNSGFYLGGWASGMDHRNDDDLNLEADYFAGVYLPINKDIALDLSATRYTFNGDDDKSVRYQDYDALSASLLVNDRWSIRWEGSQDYLGTDHSWQSISTSYVFPIRDFNLEFYLGNYHWLNKDVEEGAIYTAGGKSHYWHFRIAAERTWKKWDYRLTIERTNLGKSYDAGTIFQFGVHRYFKLL